MRTPIKAVIFDADGTLVDSEGASIDVLHELTCDLGIQLSRDQAHRQFLGVRMTECVEWIGNQLRTKPDDFASNFMLTVRQATEQRFRQGLQSLPGANELLAGLAVPFCIATNGPREKIELTLSLTNLRHHFGDRVFSAYETGFFKPDPGLFMYAAQMLGVAPQHCAVVEDSLPGVHAGLAAGMHVFTLYPSDALPADLASRVQCISGLDDLKMHLPMTDKRCL